MNDLKYQMLGDLGYSGSFDDRRFAFYKANGAVSNDINDAEFEWLGGLGFTQTSIRDRWNAYLNTIGFGNEKSEYAVSRAENLYFSPRNLFLAGEKGVWYDPSDFSTLYQDSAGTTPVTAVGQPVGLVLDKSKGMVRGAELVTNGAFDSGTGWTAPLAGAAITGGVLAFDGVTSIASSANITTGTVSVAPVVGRSYEVSYTINGGTTAGISVNFGGALGTARTAAGAYREILVATSTASLVIQARLTSAARTGSIDNVSVRELPGNHATQSTATSRPILGQVPKGGARNLLKYSEQFDNAAWTKSAAAGVTSNTVAAPDGIITADTITLANDELSRVQQPITDAASVARTYSIYLKVPSGTATIRFGDAGSLSNIVLTTTWQRFLISVTGINPNITIRNEAGAGAKTIHAWGAQLEVGSTATPYQRTTELYDVFESGQQHLNFLHFDGVDDWLSTAAIDFTSTDKMTVVAGVRKLSDAAQGTLFEFSTSLVNPGAFGAFAPASAAANYSFGSTGTIFSNAVASGFAAPITSVLVGISDISGDLARIRLNGAVIASSVTDQGTGNFGNYPLYIGRRGGTALPFNGRLYGLVVRGAQSSNLFIDYTERYLNRRTGAY